VLSHLTSLRHLDVTNAHNLQPDTLEQLVGGSTPPPLTSLALNAYEVDKLPAGISRLSGLCSLQVLNGSPEAYSVELGGLQHLAPLTRLTRLEIVACAQTEAPAAVASFAPLRQLSLQRSSSADGVVLAEGSFSRLAPLSNLTSLNLRDCYLPQMPPVLSTLTTLCHLDLSLNYGVLQDSLSRLAPLHCLTDLCLNSCGLAEVPAALAGMSALQSLDLHTNPLGVSLFEPLAPLTSLTSLNLHGCELREVPAVVTLLTCLQDLNLAFNPHLSHIERVCAASLRQLTTLRLAFCSLQQLPAAISTLTALRSLDLGGNQGLCPASCQHLALNLAPLRQLTFIDLQRCGLLELPAAVGSLTALRSLSLSSNEYMQGTGLQRMSALRQLTTLSLHACGITVLPAALRYLTDLQSLSLSNNKKLEPGSFGCLSLFTRLKVLNLNWCGLTQVPKEVSALHSLETWGNKIQ